MDQAHEQNSKMVKGCDGAVGLIENPSALKKWMISRPEQTTLLKEFEDCLSRSKGCELGDDHEEEFSVQKNFKQEAASLIQMIEEMGNPFLDDSNELLALDTRNVLGESVVDTVRKIHSLVNDQYAKYCK